MTNEEFKGFDMPAKHMQLLTEPDSIENIYREPIQDGIEEVNQAFENLLGETLKGVDIPSANGQQQESQNSSQNEPTANQP